MSKSLNSMVLVFFVIVVHVFNCVKVLFLGWCVEIEGKGFWHQGHSQGSDSEVR